MSAYGAIVRAAPGPVPSTTWLVNSKLATAPKYLTIHNLTLETAQKFPGLVEYLCRVFADELARGQTYPQEVISAEEYTLDQFSAYYFAADVLVAVLGLPAHDGDADPLDLADGKEVAIGFGDAVAGRSWEDCIAGCYYVSTLFFRLDCSNGAASLRTRALAPTTLVEAIANDADHER